MKYLYYPGCSLEGAAREYDLSTRSFMAAAGAELIDIPGWSCCGATAAQSVNRLLSLVLPARNLALAEQMDGGRDLLVPCSACYLNLKKAEEAALNDPETLAAINEVLGEEGLEFKGRTRVRHLLDVLSRDLGAETLAGLVTRPLDGLGIAPYYGCQCLRPYAVFDDPEAPTSMEPLIRAAGGEIFPWSMGNRCCGASHITTKPEVSLELVGKILKKAKGADAIVTVCPMCQMNLEAYQQKVSRLKGEDLKITILYLPQLLGLALGLSGTRLGLDLNLAVTRAFNRKFA